MSKIILIIKKFMTVDFLKFCFIGVINTFIHLLIYNWLIGEYGGTIANTVAFIASSIFSYFTNSIFTYKKKIVKTTFILSMIAFIIKLFISDGLEYVFSLTFREFGVDYLIKLNPIFITIILTPLQFLVFNKIFEVTHEENI